jgi:hypothetical protein
MAKQTLAVEVPELITTPEQLEAIVNQEAQDTGEDTTHQLGDDGGGGAFEDKGPDGKPKPPADDEEGGEGSEAPVTYNNALEYLNDRFEIGLAVDKLPKEISAEEEYEAVGDLIERMTTGFNNKLGEFQLVTEILKDKEVTDFIEAKKAGKTMKDFATAYAATPDGMDDESLVRRDLKAQYPGMADDKLNSIVQGYKDKEMLTEVATAARQRMRTTDEAMAASRTKEADRVKVREAEDHRKEVESYALFLKGVTNVYGVPLTEEMKKQIFTAVTGLDENGEAYLDKALQSNEGVTLAALGVLMLKELLGGKRSISNNKANKKLIDRLFEDTTALQSGAQGHQGAENTDEQDALVGNTF